MVHYNSAGRWGWLDESAWKNDMRVVAGDIQDQSFVAATVAGCDTVFHLAALIAIPYSYIAPTSYVQTNIGGTLNVLEAARKAGIRRLVHTSTSEVYGTAQYVPIDEKHPLQAQSPYAASKLGADKLVESYYCSFDLPAVTVRPFNTFGPRQSARAVIPTIISQCLTQDEVRLGSLTPTRDLNYVGNTVDGFVQAAQCDQALGRTINLGTGKEVSIGQLAETIAELVHCQGARACATGNDESVATGNNGNGAVGVATRSRSSQAVRISSEQQRKRPASSEVERLLADTALAQELLGWQPAVTFEEGLDRTISWFRDNVQRYRTDVYNV